jgi:hypothetical protein
MQMFDRGSEGHAAILERGRISFLSTDGEASRENDGMLRIRVWIAAVWLAFDTASVVAQAPSTGEVHGVVKLKDTGAPGGGAYVELWTSAGQPKFPPAGQEGEYIIGPEIGQPALSATVQSDGSFSITGVAPGQYSVFLYKEGYIRQDPREVAIGIRVQAVQTVKVAAGERREVDLELERGGAIEGHVTGTANAEAAISMEVQIGPATFSRYGGAAHTDAAGHYRIEGLPTGQYLVFAASQRTVAEGGPIWFAPRAVRRSKAQVVEVRAGDTIANVDIAVPADGLHLVSGTVANTAGEPVTKGLVRLYAAGEREMLVAEKPGGHGEFSFRGVPDEKYSLCFESLGDAEPRGMTGDGKSLRMFQHKPPYKPVCHDISVSGQDVSGITLEPEPNP